MALSSLIVKITADSSAFQREIAATQRSAQKMADQFKAAGDTLIRGISIPLGGLAIVALKSAAQMEQLERGLAAVAGGSQKAAVQLERLKKVADLPGLGFREAVQGSINLQAAGLSADTAERALKAFGGALATVGKGRADLDGVVRALSQIQSKGKVTAEEINQLAERLPQIRVAMQAAFNTSNTEEIQTLGISSKEFVEKIITQFEKLPPVTGGLANSFENLRDRVEQSLANLGKSVAPFAVAVLNVADPIIKKVGEMGDAFAALPGPVKTGTVALLGIAVAAGPLLRVAALVKELQISALGLAGGLSKIGIGAGAGLIGLTAMFGTGAVVAMLSNLDKLEEKAKSFDAALKKLNPDKPKTNFFDIDVGSVAQGLKGLEDQAARFPGAFKAAGEAVGNFGIASVKEFKNFREEANAAFSSLGLKSTTELKKAVADAVTALETLKRIKKEGTGDVDDADITRAIQRVTEAQKNLNIEYEKAPKLVAKAFIHPETTLFLEQESRARRKLVDDILALRDSKQKLLDLENGLSLIEAGAPEFASLQAQAFKAQETAVLSLSGEFGKHVDLMKEVRNEGSLVAQMFEATAARTREILAPMRELDAALKGLGLRDLSAQAEQATADLQKVSQAFADGAVSAATWKKAWIGMIKIQDAAGIKIDPETFRLMKELEAETGSSIKVMENSWKSLGKEVRQVVAGMSRGIAETIVQGRSLGESFKGVAQNISSMIITYAINQGLRKLGDELGELTGVVGRLGRELSKVFGSISTPALAAGDAATKGAGDAGGKAASAAVGSLAGMVTAVSSSISAVFDVLQFTQLRRIEQDIGRIEVTSRGQLNQLVSLQGTFNQYLPLLLNTSYLQSIDSGIRQIYEGLGAIDFTGGRGGGITITGPITINAQNGTPQEIMQGITRFAKLQDRSFSAS